MTTLNNKAEMALLIQNPDFQDLLEIDTLESFDEHCSEKKNQPGYYSTKVDEEASGIQLFCTPKKGNFPPRQFTPQYGTWLSVSRIFGDLEKPFRVQAAEYVPWGSDCDLLNIGDFKTLGEALDLAFMAHEQGTIELDVRGRDAQGNQRMLPAEVQIPTVLEMSAEAQLVNFVVEDLTARRQERMGLKQEKARAKQRRYEAAIDLGDAPALLNRIREKLEASDITESHDSQVHLASAINKHLFAGRGYLLDCYNKDLRGHEVIVDGAVYVAIESGSDLAYYNADGVFRDWADAEAAMVKNLGKRYKPQMSDLGGDRMIPVCWFEDAALDVNLDLNAVTPIIEVPEIDLDEKYPVGAIVPVEFAVERIVRDVAHKYKVAREQGLRKTLEVEGLSL